jgi:predicted TIM-barrel fold metal-dependent hydrolase
MLGIERVVFTQPSVYGTDNSAILDAMAALNRETPDQARCVVALDMNVGEDELAALDAAGVRGVRLNTDNKGGMPIRLADVPELAARIQALGWHIEFLFPGNDILELMPVFTALTVPMSIAHFAYQPAAAGIEAAPERILWGTDWPHPNKYLVNPNDGDLVDAFGDWVTDEATRRRIMVETPAAFYRF